MRTKNPDQSVTLSSPDVVHRLPLEYLSPASFFHQVRCFRFPISYAKVRERKKKNQRSIRAR